MEVLRALGGGVSVMAHVRWVLVSGGGGVAHERLQ